jgi:hypothetical protein
MLMKICTYIFFQPSFRTLSIALTEISGLLQLGKKGDIRKRSGSREQQKTRYTAFGIECPLWNENLLPRSTKIRILE